jgi:cytochrome c-type biogenesis protein CcmH/NrfG
MDPGNLNIWLMLGEAYMKSNPPDMNKSFAAYQKALDIDPSNKRLRKNVNSLSRRVFN